MGTIKKRNNLNSPLMLLKVLSRDNRYKMPAYSFVISALNFTRRRIKRKGHITGQELLEGIKKLGIEQFGPMAKTVFEHWGINSTNDFGEIVFNMIDAKILSKTEHDSKDDFNNKFDFKTGFDNYKYSLK